MTVVRLKWIGKMLCVGVLGLVLSACGGGGGSSGAFPTTYTITATAGSGGSISPSSITVISGGTASFTVTPSLGYNIGVVAGCGGTLSGNTYTTAAITSDCTVSATFIPSGVTYYTVTASAGSGGSINPTSANVVSGGTVTFTVTASSGYSIVSVTGCGGTLSGSSYTTGAVTANCAVSATFGPSPGNWIWWSGSSSVGAKGVYGTLGVAAAGNVPGGRSGAAAWTGAGGVAWLFGGHGYDSIGALDELNDLWKYDPSSRYWTWVGGSNKAPAKGVYGTLGMAAAGNVPGGRSDAATWSDASGNLWLFGGYGYDATGYLNELNDLWKYDLSNGYWTWVGGSSSAAVKGVYGTLGTAAASNMPGARHGAAVWTDASGNVWVFGGYGYDSTGYRDQLNDLWKYDPSNGYWTWVGGSNKASAKGVYGIQGVAAAGNMPGARYGAAFWSDASGNLWLFGGYGYDATGYLNQLNDLWEYDPSSGYWTWVGGSNKAAAKGVYGSRGVAAAGNMPGARYGATAWTDISGNTWLLGGSGYDASGVNGYLNDLWKYDPSTGYWTWMGGSSAVSAKGVYGTLGVPSPSNMPGARYDATAWTDVNGNAWLFGGYGYDASGSRGYLNDLRSVVLQ